VALLEVLEDAKPPGLAGRITYHSPVTCPACSHTFTGTWTQCADKEDQACPCGETWPEAWAGWTLLPERDRGRYVPLGDRDGRPGGLDTEALAS
jgi:hypothetical protein